MNQLRHFDLELAELKRSLATMGNLVEQSLAVAVQAIDRPDIGAREQCRTFEDQIDALETAIEERCQQIIALQNPLAGELRLVLSAMRVTTELEQMGDHAESLAKRAAAIARSDATLEIPTALEALGALTLTMARHTLEAFIAGNLGLAKGVMIDEDEADDLTKQCYEWIQEAMQRQPQHIRDYTNLIRAAGLLEHIADVAVSIAEETVYLYRGMNVRHHHEALPPQ
jgi:phosphate transport system protein